MMHPRIPSATYRLQFNHSFTLPQALQLVDYFYELGISDFYASPITKAQPGSLHGYDVIDHTQINPEVGTQEDMQHLAAALQQKKMGLVLDIVPNHMCISDAANAWWNDVLENGPSSVYANHFNIFWDPPKPELKNKVLLPVLDQQYGKVIDNQDLKLIYSSGGFFIDFKGRHFPVNPSTWPTIIEPAVKELEQRISEEDPLLLELQSILTALSHLPDIGEVDVEKRRERHREKEIIKKRLSQLMQNSLILQTIENTLKILNGKKEDPQSFNQLEELLKRQAYRLSYWRVTNDEINYRRFFDVNDLANVRVEDVQVFNDVHELILSFVKQGWVTGLRIDHIDGLFDPQAYLLRLQQKCQEVLGQPSSEIGRDFYIVVEKILVGSEELRSEWLSFGTTGYDDLNLLNGIFVDTENATSIQQTYEQFTGQGNKFFDEVIYQSKKLILIVLMSSELHILARQLEKISEQHRWSRDFTLESLRLALREVIACFPVYRSYIRAQQVAPEDRMYITTAIENAKKLNPVIEPSIFDFVKHVLLLEDPAGLSEEQIAYRRDFVMRFQQLTGPVTAKGVEDTAFYRYYPLASLNEVGMDYHLFGISVEYFHQKNLERLQKWPHTLLATSTHDTKRSEDVRARLNVLSEMPEQWHKAVWRWHDMNQDKKSQIDHRKVPDANEEYLLYQTIVGSWPLYPMDAAAHMFYIDRIDRYMNKAIKEAKNHTSWINVNEAYEKAVSDFIHKILTPTSDNRFLQDLIAYVQPLIHPGLMNSLSQTLIKMTSPGVPDFYQGSELWEFNLVDPDNRRPVDYTNRERLLNLMKGQLESNKQDFVLRLQQIPEDSLIKLYLIYQTLTLRRSHPQLFNVGGYEPLVAQGTKAKHVIAFSRRYEQECMIVVVGRFYHQLGQVTDQWKETFITVEHHLEGEYEDILTGHLYQVKTSLALDQLFASFPFTLLYKVK